MFAERNLNLVDRKRIELLPRTCKAPVLPLSLTAHNLVVREGIEPNCCHYTFKQLFYRQPCRTHTIN